MEDNEKTYIVYKLTSPSDKVYIGITYQKPERRWRNGTAYQNNKHLTAAISKYGWSNFKHEILYSNLTEEEAVQKEIELINYYDSTDQSKGYNIDNGGMYAGKHSEETREKISKSKLGKYAGDKNPFYHKKHTEETKSIISKKSKRKIR